MAEIRDFLQTAVSQQLIPLPPDNTYPDGRILHNWLKTYGIGVDCSSFVQQTLIHLLNASHTAVGQSPPASYDGLAFLKSFRTYREIKNTAATSQQMPRRKRARDDAFRDENEETSYLLGRLTALEQFCQTHPAPPSLA